MTQATQIFTDVDYNKDGKQVSWLYFPYSVTRSAYGNIAFPIAVIKNGEGPTLLLMSGAHGDEYEGQIAFCRLIRELDPKAIKGRIIVLPAGNLPAALAGTRVSPLDGGNLNRAFPGDPVGGPTSAIAHYIETVLLPMSNYYFDCHSGGGSLQYEPFVLMRKSGDASLDRRAMGALKAFGAPKSVIWLHAHSRGNSVASALSRGIVLLGGEFGSGGAVSRRGIAIVERGVRNLLAFAGMIDGQPTAPAEPTCLFEIPNRDYYTLAPDAGIYEPAVDLGDEVKTGDLAGEVHFVDDPMRAPVPTYFRASGRVVCKRHFGRVERGDCVAHLASRYRE